MSLVAADAQSVGQQVAMDWRDTRLAMYCRSSQLGHRASEESATPLQDPERRKPMFPYALWKDGSADAARDRSKPLAAAGVGVA